MDVIEPCSGTAFRMRKGDRLTVFDLDGEQVSDLFSFNESDHEEYFSSGRTIDYNEKFLVGKHDLLYSSKSRPMFEIVEDTVGRHDILVTPCSEDTFKYFYRNMIPKPGCQGNLLKAFRRFGIHRDCLPPTFNIFMNVQLNGASGRIQVSPPLSRRGDFIQVKALMNMVVGLTACSAPQSNNYNCTRIGYQVEHVERFAPPELRETYLNR